VGRGRVTILRLINAGSLVVAEDVEEGSHVRMIVSGPARPVTPVRSRDDKPKRPGPRGKADLIVAVRDWDLSPRCPNCDHPV
jgi:hypothetical protein